MPATLFRSELSPRQANTSFHVPSDLVAAATICLLLTTVAVAAKTFISVVDLRRLQIDDYAIIFAGFFFVAFTAVMIAASQAGLGVDVSLLSSDAVKSGLLQSNILDIMYTPIMLAAKISILVQVDRMFSGNKQRLVFWSVRALAYLNALVYIVMFFTNVFACSPRAKIMDPSLDGKCIPQKNIILTSGTVNVVSDVLVLLFAVWGVSRLQLSGKRQTLVAVIFSIGSFACIASVCRLAFGARIQVDRNYTQIIWPTHMWSLAEITAIMYIACCPVLPRLIQYARGQKTPPAMVNYKGGKDMYSTDSIISSASSSPKTSHSFDGTMSPDSKFMSPRTSPTPPSGFPAPQKPASATVRVTPGPSIGTRSSRKSFLPSSRRPLTSYQLPPTVLEPNQARKNFSHPVRAPTQHIASQVDQSKMVPRYVAPVSTPTITPIAADRASTVSANTAIDDILKSYGACTPTAITTPPVPPIPTSTNTYSHKRTASTPRTPKTPTTPYSYRSSTLTVPPSPSMPGTPGTPGTPVSPARTEFSIALVESAVRMKIMPVYFARRRRSRSSLHNDHENKRLARAASAASSVRTTASRASTAPPTPDLPAGVMKARMHSFKRSKSKLARGSGRREEELGTHFEV